MGSRVSLVENTTKKKLVKSTHTKIKKWPKRGRMSRRERITIGMSQMTKKLPKNPMFQLENPEEGPQVLEEKKFMSHQANPEDAQRHNNEKNLRTLKDTKGNLRTFVQFQSECQ